MSTRAMLIDASSKRLKRVIKSKGASTKYFFSHVYTCTTRLSFFFPDKVSDLFFMFISIAILHKRWKKMSFYGM